MPNFILASEVTLAAGASFSTLYLGFKNWRRVSQTVLSINDKEAELLNLQSRHGYNPHSLVSIAETDQRWFDFSTQSGAAFSRHGKICLVAGEIIAAECDLPAAANKFIADAAAKNNIAAFLPATERFARIVTVANKDFKAVKIGAAPYFNLQTWNPRGNRAKHLRANLNKGKRAGISIAEIAVIDESFKTEIAALCQCWLANRRAKVNFGWLFGLDPFKLAARKRFFAARDGQGNLMGMLAASPIPARDGWYLEDVVRAKNAPDGTTDLLVYEALKTFAAEGSKIATLGTIPLVSDGDDEISTCGNSLTKQALKFSRAHLQSIYGFDGLRRFKSRFVPDWWESEYVVAPSGLFVMPQVAHAFFRAILPNGLLNLAKRQIFEKN